MIQRPKGTRDLLPNESYKWQYVERKIANLLNRYNFKEIRVPVFEHTELFQRGVGETTDVVQKEMYTFDDKGGRSISLRPEGTAGAVRAYLENGLASEMSPVKLWYNMAMYRYENVQKGRLREFHQIGIECIGSGDYQADVDTILIGKSVFNELNIPNIKLTINSIGCPTCRAKYQEVLREFIGKNLNEYCDTCKDRFDKNPMRILDCKEKRCKELNVGAPMMIDYLCDECKEHFENVKNSLTKIGVKFEIDPSIVRGLDYYTKTVFEFIDETSGLTVLGGGRYDGLVEEIGGVPTPAIGFGLGVERMMELFDINNSDIKDSVPDVYICTADKEAESVATLIAYNLRNMGIPVEKDVMGRSFNSQMKYANKIEAKSIIVIGGNEISDGKVKVRSMTDKSKEQEVEIYNYEEIKNAISNVI